MATLETRRLSGHCGVEVRGLDVRAVDDDDMTTLRGLVGEHVALVLPEQHLTKAEHAAFAARWGVPDAFPGRSPVTPIDSEHRRAEQQFGGWHSDRSWAQDTPYVTLLHAVTIPDVGGDTLVANQCAAYDLLPPSLAQRIASLTAEHRHPNPPGRFASGSSVHPVLRVIPETGCRALFVNPAFTRRICDVSDEESRRLLFRLYNLATRPEVTYRHRWSPGDLLVWDNRCALHYAVHDYDEPRVMHRVTVAP
jgi:taurine dioxygenase